MRIRERLRKLKEEIPLLAMTLYLACRDRQTPWYAKALAAVVAAYAFSPIDLIPDFIPFLGQLDDLVIVPLGIALAFRLVPSEVLVRCRDEARKKLAKGTPRSTLAATVVVLVWVAVFAAVAAAVVARLRPRTSCRAAP